VVLPRTDATSPHKSSDALPPTDQTTVDEYGQRYAAWCQEVAAKAEPMSGVRRKGAKHEAELVH